MIKYNQFLKEAKVKADAIHDYDAIQKFELEYLEKQGYTLEKYNKLVALIKKLVKDAKIRPYVLFKDELEGGKLNFYPQRISGNSLRTRIKLKVNSSINELKEYSNLYKKSDVYLKFINDMDYVMTELSDEYGDNSVNNAIRYSYDFSRNSGKMCCSIWIEFHTKIFETHCFISNKLVRVKKRNKCELISYGLNTFDSDSGSECRIYLTIEI